MRLAKACKVSGGKGICHQVCVPRLFSMVAVVRVENIGLGARMSIWAELPRAIAYVGLVGRVDEALSDEELWEMEDNLMS